MSVPPLSIGLIILGAYVTRFPPLSTNIVFALDIANFKMPYLVTKYQVITFLPCKILCSKRVSNKLGEMGPLGIGRIVGPKWLLRQRMLCHFT
jgi:hypothetical protein